PKKLQPKAAGTTRTTTPARPLARGPRVRAPPPRRRASAPAPRRRGREGPGWRARSIFARPAPWAGGRERPAGAAWRRPDRHASAAERRDRSEIGRAHV